MVKRQSFVPAPPAASEDRTCRLERVRNTAGTCPSTTYLHTPAESQPHPPATMPPASPFPALLRCLRIPSAAAAAKRTTTATPAFTPSFFLGRGKTTIQKRFQHNPADHDPTWVSVLDKPATLVRHNRKHRPLGLAFLSKCRATTTTTTRKELIPRKNSIDANHRIRPRIMANLPSRMENRPHCPLRRPPRPSSSPPPAKNRPRRSRRL